MAQIALSGKTTPSGRWHYIKTEMFVRGKESEGLAAAGINYAIGHGYQGKKLMSKGYLVAPDGHWWLARSGGFSKGTIPNGMYNIGVVRKPWNRNKRPFTDNTGFTWFCEIWNDLVPKYGKKDLLGRYSFGIHPDGGSIGTAGCIGIVMGNTRPVYDKLKATTVKKLMVRSKDTSDAEFMEELELLTITSEAAT